MTQHMAAAAVLLLLATAAAEAQPSGQPWLHATACLDREAVPRGGTIRAAVVIDMGAGYHINANPPSPKWLIPAALAPQEFPATWKQVRYPPGKTFSPKWAEGRQVSVYAGRTFLLAEGTVQDDAPLGPAMLQFKLDYQGCSETSCFQPASLELEAPVRILHEGAAAVAANAAVFAEAAAAFAPPPPPAEPIRFEGETNLAATFEQSLFLYLGALLVGGLLLNLTPCVFPLVPVTMTVFAQQGEHRPLKVLPLAALYVLGLAATFTVVGVLAALAGKSLGLVLQQPVGVLAVVAILAAMMASMFGAFEIRLPSGLMGKLGARRGYLGAAFMGMVMGAIAAPCVGPFLFALITFVATTRSVPLGAVSFFVTGLGLGLPYVVLGVFTGQINRFPRSGGWLVWTKRLLGLALAGLILYYVRPYVVEAFFWPLVLALFLFAALYLGLLEGLERRPFTRRFLAVRIATAAGLLATGIGTYTWATAPRPEVAWTAWRPGALEAAEAKHKPVLLYFGADWCIACREWHASVFTQPSVVRASKEFVTIYVDVTQLEEGPKREFAERFQAVNPPAVFIIDPHGKTVAAYRNPPDVGSFMAHVKPLAGMEG